jgi:hypothetical protein
MSNFSEREEWPEVEVGEKPPEENIMDWDDYGKEVEKLNELADLSQNKEGKCAVKEFRGALVSKESGERRYVDEIFYRAPKVMVTVKGMGGLPGERNFPPLKGAAEIRRYFVFVGVEEPTEFAINTNDKSRVKQISDELYDLYKGYSERGLKRAADKACKKIFEKYGEMENEEGADLIELI